jgi:hypothetical protein
MLDVTSRPLTAVISASQGHVLRGRGQRAKGRVEARCRATEFHQKQLVQANLGCHGSCRPSAQGLLGRRSRRNAGCRADPRSLRRDITIGESGLVGDVRRDEAPCFAYPIVRLGSCDPRLRCSVMSAYRASARQTWSSNGLNTTLVTARDRSTAREASCSKRLSTSDGLTDAPVVGIPVEPGSPSDCPAFGAEATSVLDHLGVSYLTWHTYASLVMCPPIADHESMTGNQHEKGTSECRYFAT